MIKQLFDSVRRCGRKEGRILVSLRLGNFEPKLGQGFAEFGRFLQFVLRRAGATRRVVGLDYWPEADGGASEEARLPRACNDFGAAVGAGTTPA